MFCDAGDAASPEAKRRKGLFDGKMSTITGVLMPVLKLQGMEEHTVRLPITPGGDLVGTAAEGAVARAAAGTLSGEQAAAGVAGGMLGEEAAEAGGGLAEQAGTRAAAGDIAGEGGTGTAAAGGGGAAAPGGEEGGGGGGEAAAAAVGGGEEAAAATAAAYDAMVDLVVSKVKTGTPLPPPDPAFICCFITMPGRREE